MLRSVTLSQADQVRAVWSQWDALAVRAAKPFCAPAWMMAWWEHVAPPDAKLRVSAMYDGDDLVAIAPFFMDRGLGGVRRYRLLGAGTSAPIDILASDGTERAVAAALVKTLSETAPRPDVVMFEGIPTASPWTALLCELWPRLRVRSQYSQPSPFIEVQGTTYDQWFTSRSASFRSSLRRGLRAIEEVGGSERHSANATELAQDLEAFARLHRTRWSKRGEAGAVDARVERMLMAAGTQLIEDGRFQLWTMRVNDRDISAHIFVAAGGTTSYWLGGFDKDGAGVRQPAIMTIRSAVEHAFRSGITILDLGPGAQTYKYSFARLERSIDWVLLIPPGWRSLPARAQMVRPRARILLAQRLTPSAKRVVRRLLAWKGALQRKKYSPPARR
jgi:CelD/BcsL family acetyltransferase involved in cellulose biosynthesis